MQETKEKPQKGLSADEMVEIFREVSEIVHPVNDVLFIEALDQRLRRCFEIKCNSGEIDD
ncbi:hypothetical protein ACFLYP_03810 [Chloroflexota bacterium]